MSCPVGLGDRIARAGSLAHTDDQTGRLAVLSGAWNRDDLDVVVDFDIDDLMFV